MSLATLTSVDNARPARFSITVTEASKAAPSQKLDILVVVEERGAALSGGDPAPNPAFATPTTLVWTDELLQAGKSRTFTVVVESTSAQRTTHSTPIAYVVSSAASGYLDTAVRRVCFPPVEQS